MALSADTPRDLWGSQRPTFEEYDAQAAVTIYEGAIVTGVGVGGYARGANAADFVFLGICYRQCDNSSGAAAAKKVKVYSGVFRMKFPLTGVGLTHVGQPVYATADDTLTLTEGTNPLVGQVIAKYATNVAIVEFWAPRSKGWDHSASSESSSSTST